MAEVSSGVYQPTALSDDVIAEFLPSCALFRGCDPRIVEQLAPHVRAYDVPLGQVIQRAGATDGHLGIVFAGKVHARLVHPGTGAATVLEELGVGDYFGEVGAMLQQAHPHEITAESNVTILIVPREAVQQLAAKLPAFTFAIAKKLASKVTQIGATALRVASRTAPPPVADKTQIRFVRTAAYNIDAKLIAMVPSRLIVQHRVFPLELVGRQLTIGMVNPFNTAATTELERVITSADLTYVAIAADDWNEAIIRFRIDPGARGYITQREQVPVETLQFDAVAAEAEGKSAIIGDDVVALVSRIIASGVERGASDVHIEPELNAVRVRFRAAGALVDWDQHIPASYARGIVARFKVLAGLDITERRLPQDGRIGLRAGKREIDLRVSTLPASRGEKVAIRLLEAASLLRPLESIFVDPRVLGWVRGAINRPHGAIVVAGPTGSGKSSTLYASLNERRKTRPDTNILMVEDPIEYRLGGATQVQVNPAIELSFARVLRAFLRQDPDVIMVGEIRDRDTAMMALEAAMTGHLLFTSIHANDALRVLQRFENLGCHREVVAQALSLVLVQRLARKVCPRCVTTEVPAPVLLESLEQRGLIETGSRPALPRGVGCADCLQTGYQGRIAVIEALQFPEQVRDLLMSKGTIADVEDTALAHQAYVPFRQTASYLMSKNLLTPSEALLTVA